jgi:hypothetical protein
MISGNAAAVGELLGVPDGVLVTGAEGLLPEFDSLPHPVRTRPAAAASAAYRMFFTSPFIPTCEVRAAFVQGLVHECHPVVRAPAQLATLGRNAVPIDRWLQRKN